VSGEAALITVRKIDELLEQGNAIALDPGPSPTPMRIDVRAVDVEEGDAGHPGVSTQTHLARPGHLLRTSYGLPSG